jgi:hypothetical protein
MLPREYPPWPTVYARFRRWRVSGTLRRAHDALRAQVRVAEGREAEASAAVIDSQSAKTTEVGGPAARLRRRKAAERAQAPHLATSWSTPPAWCCWRASTPPTCMTATGRSSSSRPHCDTNFRA